MAALERLVHERLDGLDEDDVGDEVQEDVGGDAADACADVKCARTSIRDVLR